MHIKPFRIVSKLPMMIKSKLEEQLGYMVEQLGSMDKVVKYFKNQVKLILDRTYLKLSRLISCLLK